MKRVVDALNTIANALVSTLLSLSKRELDHAVALNTLTALTNSLATQDAIIAKLKARALEHEAQAADLAQKLSQAETLNADLMQQLNQVNTRCAALQQAVLQQEQPITAMRYWFARSNDGTVVGPFATN